jgi:16S rRNA (uracil1498-N3)-methyltransferase
VRLTRCYLPGEWRDGTTTILPREQSDHLVKVLRLRSGAAVEIFDGAGHRWQATLADGERSRYQLRIGAALADEPEPRMQLTLLQGLARAEKMDWIVQKATELGVHAIQPLITEFSVVRVDARQSERKAEHWQAVAKSACEQCGRSRLPVVSAPIEMREFTGATATNPDTLRWVLDPGAGDSLVQAADRLRERNAIPARLQIVIGPEGGLSAAELQQLVALGAMPFCLGPRILRTETAAVAALALLQGLLGDLRTC